MEIFLQMFLIQYIINKSIQKSARNVIVGFFIVVGVTTVVAVGFQSYKVMISQKKIEITKPDAKVKKEAEK